MGLAEKRIIKTLEESAVPETKERLSAALGKDVEIDINWDSFDSQAQLQEVEHQCLGRIAEGLEKLAQDDMGKEALAESVNTLVINNIDDADAKKIALADGKLTVDGKWEDFGSGIFTPGDYATQVENLL